jgi:Family of unknown function (DUF5829)
VELEVEERTGGDDGVLGDRDVVRLVGLGQSIPSARGGYQLPGFQGGGAVRPEDRIPHSGRDALRSQATYALALLALLAAARGSGAPAASVLLNHFFVVVDAATYEAARHDAFLTTELAPFEVRTTVRNDTSYTGSYWYGRRTYFELFEPGGQGPAGASGLALGVEEPGASASVRERWQEAIGGAASGPVTRKTESDEVPWFEMTHAHEIPGLRVFLLEYDRHFLARWYGSLTPARGIARADVLDRYVAKIGQSERREPALFEDVVDLEIALAPADRELLVKQLRAVSWIALDAADAVVCSGPESERLRLVLPRDGRTGIVAADFSLQHAVAQAVHRFGSAELRLGGRTGRLSFSPAPAS